MSHLPRALGAIVSLALAAAAAQAGQLTAGASLNPEGLVSNPTFGSSTSAEWGTNAFSEVSRTSISVTTLGDGVSPPWVYGASGNANTNYTLWNLATDSALDGAAAAGLTLAFDFTLRGETSLPPISLSVASVSWSAALYSRIVSADGGSANMTYGPKPPFPSEGYLNLGDGQLMGSYDLSFSLLHANAGGGLWTMGLFTSASNAGDANATLALAGIRLLDGLLPQGGLGVRLETGELIAVSPVPEVAPHWMMLAGLAGIGAFVRRRTVAA